MSEFSVVAVLMVGLLGGVHCLGMCGSIVGIFTSQITKPSPEPSGETTSHSTKHDKTVQVAGYPASGRGADRLAPGGASDRRSVARWPFHLAYSGGRILSYTVAGALVGAVGQAGLLMRDVAPVQHLMFALSSLMLVVLGLYLAGVWGVVRHLERFGGGLWQRLQPYTRRLLPVNTVPRALGLGALWGWLPCGLVYSVLVTALASGSSTQGALIMAAFGLGTLPNLLAIGLFWESVKGWVQSPRVRLAAGMLVTALGGYGLFRVSYTFYVHGWTGACHVAA